LDEPNTDVRRWIESARAGSQDDFGRLVASCRKYLLAIAERELGPSMRSKGDASDLVQDACYHAQLAFHTFQGETRDEFKRWMRGILRKRMRKFYRQFATRKRERKREVSIETAVDLDTKELRLASRDPSPSARMIASEELTRFLSAFDSLPSIYQTVLLFRHREQMGFAAISAELGRSPQAVKKLWARAVVALQNQLGVK
jgi:RNA polymerase sigma-70 factor (ECF subfamily)